MVPRHQKIHWIQTILLSAELCGAAFFLVPRHQEIHWIQTLLLSAELGDATLIWCPGTRKHTGSRQLCCPQNWVVPPLVGAQTPENTVDPDSSAARRTGWSHPSLVPRHQKIHWIQTAVLSAELGGATLIWRPDSRRHIGSRQFCCRQNWVEPPLLGAQTPENTLDPDSSAVRRTGWCQP